MRLMNAGRTVLPAVALALGGLWAAGWTQPAKAQRGSEGDTGTLATDVNHLKDITPPASHPMVEVGYHTANLWFAAQKKNWPLANYYWGETRNRLRWEVKLNPSPKGASGQPVDMKATLDGIENGSLKQVKDAIDKQDVDAFSKSYRSLLEDCYSCHKNANRPYLRPMVPTTPGEAIINPDPNATWPQ